MGFLDGDVENSFDALFDFNRDGKLDAIELAAEYDFIEHDGELDADEGDEDY